MILVICSFFWTEEEKDSLKSFAGKKEINVFAIGSDKNCFIER